MDKLQLIAYYLPQFYEIEFNNQYWGKGYTEWTATANAKPLFKGHYQPHVPADLGFYNLLMPETQVAQAKLAQEYGVDGFCYWHYWFGGGKTIMEKPLNNMLANKDVDIPFCLAWANHSWHNPRTKEIILEQSYPGRQDHIDHFYSLLPAFRDERYIKHCGKLIFSIFAPPFIPNLNEFIDLWNELAKKEGLEGFYFIGQGQTPERIEDYKQYKLDSINIIRLNDHLLYQSKWKSRILHLLSQNRETSYSSASKYFVNPIDIEDNVVPTIIAGWDHSPRTGRNGLILTDYTPESFVHHLKDVFDIVSKKNNKLCFIKSWNEWGEGNHLEPDLKYGTKFLEVLKEMKHTYN